MPAGAIRLWYRRCAVAKCAPFDSLNQAAFHKKRLPGVLSHFQAAIIFCRVFYIN